MPELEIQQSQNHFKQQPMFSFNQNLNDLFVKKNVKFLPHTYTHTHEASTDFYVCMCVSHHGRGGLLHGTEDESLAVLPDLVLPITQSVHQSWQDYRQKQRWIKGEKDRERGGVEIKDSKWKMQFNVPTSSKGQMRPHDSESLPDLNAKDNQDCPHVECF